MNYYFSENNNKKLVFTNIKLIVIFSKQVLKYTL